MLPDSSKTRSTVRPIVVAPTYNNARTLPDILRRLDRLELHIVVINDGCTDGTAAILDAWVKDQDARLKTVVTHSINRGKAAALRTGFQRALELGFTHAITIDTDGQLDPEDIPELLERAKSDPRALVIGVRDECVAGYPARSRVGRRLSNFLIWLESGVTIADSQCGLRVYPLELVRDANCRAGHFGFETEIITRAGWAKAPVVGVPVTCRYLPLDQRVSHFRPGLDSLRALRMHARLLLRAMWPLPRQHASASRVRFSPKRAWAQFVEWISPARAWRQVRDDKVGRTGFCAGFALGVFIANLPLYGLQTLISLYTARRLHLHPLSVVAGSQVSTPPIGPAMIVAAITVGHLLLHGSMPALADYDLTRHDAFGVLWPLLLEWVVGGVLIGVVMAIVAFVAADVILRAIFVRERTRAAALPGAAE